MIFFLKMICCREPLAVLTRQKPVVIRPHNSLTMHDSDRIYR